MVGRAKCPPNDDVAKVQTSWSSIYHRQTTRRLRAVRIALSNFVLDTAFFLIDGDRGGKIHLSPPGFRGMGYPGAPGSGGRPSLPVLETWDTTTGGWRGRSGWLWVWIVHL